MKRFIWLTPLIIGMLVWASDSTRGDAEFAELCHTCHPAPTANDAHHIGVKPTFELPAKFKLGPGGTLTCSTCHVSPTAEQQKKLTDDGSHEGTRWLVSDNANSAICAECHAIERDYSGEKGKGHGHPVIDVAADNERAAKIIKAEGKLGKDGLVICQSCHKPHGGVNAAMNVLNPLNSGLCLSCHENRATAQKGRIANHPVERRVGRVDSEFAKTALFGKGRKVECVTCHKPHGAPSDSSFLSMVNDQSQLCTACHTDKKRLANGPHGADKVCANCHAIHDSPAPRHLWKWEVAGGKVSQEAGFCKNCHSKDGAASSSTVSISNSHPMGKKMEGAEDGFARTVSCSTCHSVHRGPSEPGGRVSYVKIYDGNGGLCVGCHKDRQSIENTPHKMNGGQGMCRKCHRMHRPSVKADLWGGPLGSAPGAITPQRECLGCHRKGGFASAKVPAFWDHPEEIAAAVADGAKFYTAKGKLAKTDEAARIACATCHDPHSTAAKFLRPSGDIIAFCAGCHDTEAQERYKSYHTDKMRQKK